MSHIGEIISYIIIAKLLRLVKVYWKKTGNRISPCPSNLAHNDKSLQSRSEYNTHINSKEQWKIE